MKITELILADLFEGISKDELIKNLQQKRESKYLDMILKKMHELVQTRGNRQSIGGSAFDISRMLGGAISGRELESLYKQKYINESQINEWGRIVKGVNTTADVDTDEIKTQAAKFGNSVDKDGRPPSLSKKVKGSKTNVLYNLGLAEGYKLQLERDRKILVLHIFNTDTGYRTEVRGKPGYESGNYDPNDDLHQLLDTIGKSANISELINGEVVTINPKHPDAERAKAATDKAYNERYTPIEIACIEGGHSLDDLKPLKEKTKTPGKIFETLINLTEDIAPHGSPEQEAQLMIAGKKPAALTYEQDFFKYFQTPAEMYNWVVLKFDQPNSSHTKYVVAQPGEDSRAKEIASLVTAANKINFKFQNKNQEINYHQTLGNLLGYKDSDIEDFIKSI